MTLYRKSPDDGAAWVTGASTGIGFEAVKLLVNQGFTVYASARSEDRLQALAESCNGPGRVVALPLDVTDRTACSEAAERISSESGGISLVILNAGNFFPIQAFELSYSQFDSSMDINFFGVVNCLVPTIEKMSQSGKGHIAIVSSSAAYGGLPKSAAYGASKAALVNMAESLKFDLDNMNIRLQIVTPGFVRSPLTDKNDFEMPFIMETEDAAKALLRGLDTEAFDITFPRRFTYILKFLNLLPYRLYFGLVARQTGSRR